MVVYFGGSLGLLLLLSPLLTSADPVHPNIVARAAPGKYFAQGDSYGSGIAAGTYVNLEIGSMDWARYMPKTDKERLATGFWNRIESNQATDCNNWFCSRFTQAYGRQLTGLLGGSADFQHQASSGQNALQVQTTQEIDSDADLMTLTVGGNDANFGDIVDKCVYGFTTTGDTTDRCNAAIAATQNNIANSVWNPVWNTYAGPDGPNKMTQALRQGMNDLSTQLNNQLASDVQNFHNNGENRVQLVDIDSVFQGHRFCEDGVDEPQQSGNDNSNTWIF
ncbi:hypothetical protein OEA41_009107 [Lepraria neglecta]|uniref:SGNH hydrolase-type esterase domain-containing protein n=1 Tax=Lepraria neglecta TaxID=209136 RepID=A0AAE0DJW8_9LECA|nr:hypothetical protein OEA41_009107 [Lepraria neglecta]